METSRSLGVCFSSKVLVAAATARPRQLRRAAVVGLQEGLVVILLYLWTFL